MKEFLIYLAEAGAGIMLFVAIYRLFLEKETFFRLNRYFLLVGSLVALLIPLLKIKLGVAPESALNVMISTVNVGETIPQYEQTTAISPFQMILGIYLLGVALLALNFIFRLFLIFRLISRSEIQSEKNYKLIVTEKDFSAFSFFRFVFVSKKTLEKADFQKILAHEKVHVRQKHSLDRVFFEMLSIFQWFNPFAWVLKKKLHENHEYLADQGVLQRHFDRSDYHILLLEESIGAQMPLSNNFNQNLTIKRLEMMNKIQSKALSRLKILLALPLIAVLVVFFACENNQEELLDKNDSKTEIVVNEKTAETPPAVSETEKSADANDEIFFVVEEMPKYPGKEEGLRSFLAQNIQYPPEAKEQGISGKVYVKFVVNEQGETENVSVARSAHPLLDAEAVRVVKLLEWKPGKKRGKKVKVWYTVPINFALQ